MCEEEQKEESPLESEQPVYEKLMDGEFEIPKLLRERNESLEQEFEQLKESELKRLSEMTDDDIQNAKGEHREQEIIERGGKVYRKVEVFGSNSLKNGQMVNISISNVDDENSFDETNKIIVYNHEGKYYATAAFCSYDYTILSNGVVLNDKVFCPTCGSGYNLTNGFVDDGPALRNIASFPCQTRKGIVSAVLPEDIPPFGIRNISNKGQLDPRTFVVVGDSEAALSAVITLRTSGFTGRVVLIPTSSYGAFQNKEAMLQNLGPLNKDEVYSVESDLFSKMDIEVESAQLKHIIYEERTAHLTGNKSVHYDKILIAAGSEKERLPQSYSNVHVIEDHLSHAKVHNDLLKANQIVVIGSGLEAIQAATSARGYLDSIGVLEPKVVIMDTEMSQLRRTFGPKVEEIFKRILKSHRISFMSEVKIVDMQGDHKLEKIVFTQPEDRNRELFLKPDVVLMETGRTKCHVDPRQILSFKNPDLSPTINSDTNSIRVDKRFSVVYGKIMSSILAAGESADFWSFMGRGNYRQPGVAYNTQSGMFAALNMMDKTVEMLYVPMQRIKMPDNSNVYYIGEKGFFYDEVLIDGDVTSKKFVLYLLKGDEIMGFITFGFQNLHLYLREAMKLLILPNAQMMRLQNLNYKHIVAGVLKHRDRIYAKRHELFNIRTEIHAVKGAEVDYVHELRAKMKDNVKEQKDLSRERFKDLKRAVQSNDDEAIEHITEEYEIGKKEFLPEKKIDEDFQNVGMQETIKKGSMQMAAQFKEAFQQKK